MMIMINLNFDSLAPGPGAAAISYEQGIRSRRSVRWSRVIVSPGHTRRLLWRQAIISGHCIFVHICAYFVHILCIFLNLHIMYNGIFILVNISAYYAHCAYKHIFMHTLKMHIYAYLVLHICAYFAFDIFAYMCIRHGPVPSLLLQDGTVPSLLLQDKWPSKVF